MSCGESVLLIKALRVTQMKSGLFYFNHRKTCLKQVMAVNETMQTLVLMMKMMMSEGQQCVIQCTAACRKLIKN